MKKMIVVCLMFFICSTIPAFAECPEGYRVCGRTPTGGAVCCRNHMGGVQGAIDIDKNILIAQQGEQKSNLGNPAQGTKPPKAEKEKKGVEKKGECRNPQGVVIPCPNDNSVKDTEKGKPSHTQKPPVDQKAKGKPVPK